MKRQPFNPALGAILFLAAMAPFGILLGKPLSTYIGSVMPDDTFYYLVPARNFIAGLGTSFDGLNLTNGYHPLWMLITIAAVWLSPAHLELYLLPALSGLLYILGALVLAFLFFPQRSRFEKAVLFSLFCFNFYLLKVFMLGLENGLAFFILTILLVFLQKNFKDSAIAIHSPPPPPPPPPKKRITTDSGS